MHGPALLSNRSLFWAGALQETAANSAVFTAMSAAAAGQQLLWLPGVSGAPAAAAQGWDPWVGLGVLPPIGQLPGGYKGQLVSHIIAYINKLWRVDPAASPPRST